MCLVSNALNVARIRVLIEIWKLRVLMEMEAKEESDDIKITRKT
jgi:hypothetical protein